MPVRNIRRHGYRGLRGYYSSHKTNRTIAFESRLERDLFMTLDADPAVATFEEQPVTIEFQVGAQARRYTPDCRVEYRGGATEIVEVKYAADLATMEPAERARHAAAHDAATRWCEARGWRFLLRTDRDIVGPALARAQALHAFARRPHPRVELAVVEAFVASHPGVPLAELTDAFGSAGHEDAVAARHVALHLVWRGRLRDDPFAVPTEATRLYLREPSP